MLEDPPLLTIARSWQRPEASVIARLKDVQTGQAVDAMEGRGGLACEIKPLDPASARMLGPAVTCETGPNDNLAILGALAVAKAGDVIVAATEGFAHSAVVGDNVALMAKRKGIAGIVVDGMMRDLVGLLPVGLPLFCRGITPNSCVRSGPGRVGLPIVAGGVAIRSGDIVIGDRDGVVVIPQAEIAALQPKIDRILAAEADSQAKIKAGFTNLGGIDDLLKSSQVRWV
ncbi:MAG TPA: RraA family protein [Hyphomicrobiaceae bacterium]|nr:RraA family protein [Hyphomicrobiaceae bacterium]